MTGSVRFPVKILVNRCRTEELSIGRTEGLSIGRTEGLVEGIISTLVTLVRDGKLFNAKFS